MKKLLTLLFLAAVAISCNNQAEATQASDDMAAEHEHSEEATENEAMPVPVVPAKARVFFANLEDGAAISSPVYVAFGIEGMEVEPAGEVQEGMGHHHVIINGGALPTGKVVPADSLNIHYGGGQTGDTLELPTGKHSLTLQFADGFHRSYGTQMSETITVVVK